MAEFSVDDLLRPDWAGLLVCGPLLRQTLETICVSKVMVIVLVGAKARVSGQKRGNVGQTHKEECNGPRSDAAWSLTPRPLLPREASLGGASKELLCCVVFVYTGKSLHELESWATSKAFGRHRKGGTKVRGVRRGSEGRRPLYFSRFSKIKFSNDATKAHFFYYTL